jgi:guanosine-diphosphatase
MSTGVDNQQQPQKFIDLDSVARHRSVSRSNGSAVPTPVHDQVSDKQPDKMVSQSQKSRWLKTGAIVGLIFMVLLWLSPSKSAVSGFTQGTRRRSLPDRLSGNKITNILPSV